MTLYELIYHAEVIRDGETNVFVVRALLQENLSNNEIATLKAATETDSEKFGDTLLIVLTSIM
jgi:hypothetical protein